ncbi:HAMP domain-containing sensor histidine kinase [Ideonella sp. DXS29W]|uniref:histidine kinase n=1 Tax=Ideonella lacteola TaxID=2984193 RepID=A0ABU9BUB2_9BURK
MNRLLAHGPLWLDRAAPGRQDSTSSMALVASVTGLLGASLVAWQFAPSHGSPGFIDCMVLLIGFCGLRAVMAALDLKRSPSRPIVRGRVGLPGVLLHALLWGLTAVVLRAPGPWGAELALHMTTCVLAMSAAVSLAWFYPLLVAYVALLLGPLALRDAWIGGQPYSWLAWCGAVAAVYISLTGYLHARTLAAVRAQRQQNADLVDALHREVERADAAHRALCDAQASKVRFFAAANHDLRQPLQAIVLLAQSACLRPSPTQDAMQHILTCAETMSKVVDDLLDLTRLDLEDAPLHMEPIELTELFEELRRTHDPTALAQGLLLRFDANAQVVFSARLPLMRIVSNLVANALQFTRAGSVLVEARTIGEHITIEVSDTGRGISPEHLERIFDEFFQVDRRPHDGRVGLGLGLSIVKQLSRSVGIGIAVTSSPGQGSTFTLKVPASAAGLAPPARRDLVPPVARPVVLPAAAKVEARRPLAAPPHRPGETP